MQSIKNNQNILRDKVKVMKNYRHLKSIAIFVCIIMMSPILFTGCIENKVSKIELSQQEEAKVVALLGDLDKDASESVKNKLGQLVQKANTYMVEREAKGNYEMSDKEFKIWQKITSLLDKETIRQFGEDNYEEEETDKTLDYGKKTMANLKKILTEQDWKELNKIRNEYFTATENNDESYDVDIEEEIRNIINNYKELDVDAIVLNLLDDKNQQNFGMFKITPEFKAIYQDGKENGLKVLKSEEQDSLKKVWKQTTDILPKELFANFKYFKVGGDGELGTYAYVIPVDSQGKLWCMTVDPADITEDGLFPYTAVHEMVHYITLNETQVEYFNGEENYYPMDRYSDWECVAKEDSYLQAFYNEFWKDIINDWATDSENPYFYYRHQSQFVTGYSATECAEDLAESFSAYVLLDKAPTPESQAKLDFFDRYPELKKLKSDILSNIKKNKVYVNPEIEPVYDEEVEPAA